MLATGRIEGDRFVITAADAGTWTAVSLYVAVPLSIVPRSWLQKSKRVRPLKRVKFARSPSAVVGAPNAHRDIKPQNIDQHRPRMRAPHRRGQGPR